MDLPSKLAGCCHPWTFGGIETAKDAWTRNWMCYRLLILCDNASGRDRKAGSEFDFNLNSSLGSDSIILRLGVAEGKATMCLGWILGVSC
jgi:hypothetical protein